MPIDNTNFSLCYYNDTIKHKEILPLYDLLQLSRQYQWYVKFPWPLQFCLQSPHIHRFAELCQISQPKKTT